MPIDPLGQPNDIFAAPPDSAPDSQPAYVPEPVTVSVPPPAPAPVSPPTSFSPADLTDACVEGALRASLLGNAAQAFDRLIAGTAASPAGRARLASLLAGVMER